MSSKILSLILVVNIFRGLTRASINGGFKEQTKENKILPNELNDRGAKRPPNVILILADDLGYGDLGISNHPTSKTPHVDKLAHSGTVLNQFYVTNPICSPSRASLLTARYSVRSGVYPGVFNPSNYLGLPHNETTIANIFKNKGYRTQMVGKWHLGVGYNREFLPTNFGFDDFLGLPYSHDMCECEYCFPHNTRCHIPCWKGRVSCALFDNSEIIEQPVYLPTLTEKFLNRSLKFIEKANQDGVPFFLFFSFHHIHHPQFASESFGKSLRGPTGDSLLELDSTVGQLMDTVTQLGIDKNTITWFTSDNGPSLTRHEFGGCAGLLRCGKGTTWEGGVRVPSIVSWPSKISAGQKSNGLSSTLDVLPTLASLCGINIPVPQKLDGMDISRNILNQRINSPREFFAVYPVDPTPKTSPFAVVYKQYKAHFYTKGDDLSDKSNYDPMCPSSHPLTFHSPPLLFDLNSDPGERYDLGTNKEYRSIISTIEAWRSKHMEEMTWMAPRTAPYDPFAQPCCTSTSCNPFPACCDCLNRSQPASTGLDAGLNRSQPRTKPVRDRTEATVNRGQNQTSFAEEFDNSLMGYFRRLKDRLFNSFVN